MFRKRLFSWRYDSKAGFQSAIGGAYKHMMAYGVPCIHVEERLGSDAPFLYRHIPLEQIVFTVNSAGIEDTAFRKFPMTAKQMAEKFGESNLAEPVKRVLEDPGSGVRARVEVLLVDAVDLNPRLERNFKFNIYTSYYINTIIIFF